MLSNVLYSESLKRDQQTFIDKNCDKFEDVVENKLEWTNIHNEQIELMDSLIDKECEKKGFQLNLELITHQFENDHSEVIDSHVFDTLMTILDFQKFKELMLVFKNKVEQVPEVQECVSDWDRQVAALKGDIASMLESRSQLWVLKSQYSDHGAKVQGWSNAHKLQLATCSEDISKFTKVEINWKLNFDKFERMVLRGDSLDRIVQATDGCEDLEQLQQWPDQGEFHKQQVYFVRQKIPLMTTREVCVQSQHQKTTIEGMPALVVAAQSVEFPGKPCNPKEIRGQLFRAAIFKKVDDENMIQSQVDQIDLKGWIPGYILSYFMSWLFNSFMDKQRLVQQRLIDEDEGLIDNK